jgi:hypothetical protein
MGAIQEILFIALGVGAIWLGIRLFRQGRPDDDIERDLPDEPGPTGEPYPTGSRPAGPGAERMVAEPSKSKDDVTADDDQSDEDTGSQSGPD